MLNAVQITVDVKYDAFLEIKAFLKDPLLEIKHLPKNR